VAEIRAALEADEANRGIGLTPLVVECIHVGTEGLSGEGVENRLPGLYYADPARRTGPTIVFEGAEPPAELLARFEPKGGRAGPLIVVLGAGESGGREG
jgi:hypothetical protein